MTYLGFFLSGGWTHLRAISMTWDWTLPFSSVGRLWSVISTLKKEEDTHKISWWRHQMETFSALLAICAGNSPVLGEFPAQRPVTRSFDVYFDLRPNKRLSLQSWGLWFETPSRPLWSHRNVTTLTHWPLGDLTTLQSQIISKFQTHFNEINIFSIFYEIAIRWMPLHHTDH